MSNFTKFYLKMIWLSEKNFKFNFTPIFIFPLKGENLCPKFEKNILSIIYRRWVKSESFCHTNKKRYPIFIILQLLKSKRLSKVYYRLKGFLLNGVKVPFFYRHRQMSVTTKKKVMKHTKYSQIIFFVCKCIFMEDSSK